MSYTKTVLGFFLFICLVPPPALRASDKQAEGASLLHRAAELSDVQQNERYQIRYKVSLSDPALGQVAGTQSVTFAAGQFRREIHVSKYDELSILKDGQLYRVRSLPFTPPSFQYYGAEDVRDLQLKMSNTRVAKLSDHKLNGVPVRCVALVREQDRPQITWCVYADSGLAASVQLGTSQKVEFSDYGQLGKVQVPRRIVRHRDGVRIAEWRIESMGVDVPADASLFTPPPGAIARPSCSPMEPSFVIATATLDLQVRDILNQQFRNETFPYELTVGSDGHVTNVVPLTLAPKFDHPALRATLSRYLFKPAMCGGKAVPSETEFEFNFQSFASYRPIP